MSGRWVTILASCAVMIGCDGGGGRDDADSQSDPDAIADTGDGGHDTGGGPGVGGCYWDPAVGGPCGWFMSSSTHGTYPTSTWGMGYDGISFSYVGKEYGYKIRCVSTGT